MIIYSVTVSVDADIEPGWLSWMRATHIPDVMKTGYFRKYRIGKLLEPARGDGRISYTIEYVCDSMADYETYRAKAAPALQQDHSRRYQGRFEASRAIFETIDGE